MSQTTIREVLTIRVAVVVLFLGKGEVWMMRYVEGGALLCSADVFCFLMGWCLCEHVYLCLIHPLECVLEFHNRVFEIR